MIVCDFCEEPATWSGSCQTATMPAAAPRYACEEHRGELDDCDQVHELATAAWLELVALENFTHIPFRDVMTPEEWAKWRKVKEGEDDFTDAEARELAHRMRQRAHTLRQVRDTLEAAPEGTDTKGDESGAL